MTDLALPTLIPLDQADSSAVERVLDAAFGTNRRGRTAYAIRQGMACLPPLCFAAFDADDELVGTIQAFPVALTDPSGRAHPLIMVGPVAILPDRQGQGFGRALMAAQRTALAACASEGAPALPQMLIGDEPFYARFGFVQAPGGWHCPGPWDPARLLVRAANPSVLPGEGMLGPWRA
ncbi:MAG: N-acetyltransferase [Croceibacterium sp.]